METRRYKDTDVTPSMLGLGCMRLPTIAADSQEIDEVAAQALVDHAYASGITYYDTAYTYHGATSEKFMGKALSKYPRESYCLATKLPMWCVDSKEKAEELFAEQLENCRTEYFDFYLLHALNTNTIAKIAEFDLHSFLEQKKAEGKIRHYGFSFHASPAELATLCETYEWDFAQLQINYLDWEMQHADEQYAILEKHNIPCIVMEPVRGGSLASLTPECEELLKASQPDKSTASWALRWVAEKSNILVVLSGMSNMEQLQDNIDTFSPLVPLCEAQHATLNEALAMYRAAKLIPCTGCAYCMPCPMGVDIPLMFKLYNAYNIATNKAFARQPIDNMQSENRPSNCVSCGKCAAVCPQHIDIPAELARIAAELDL